MALEALAFGVRHSRSVISRHLVGISTTKTWVVNILVKWRSTVAIGDYGIASARKTPALVYAQLLSRRALIGGDSEIR